MKLRLPAGRRLETVLALSALVLGVLALVGNPLGGETVKLNPRELAALVEGEVDHVTVEELAGWIIEGRNDYRLLDVRDEASYAEYHIPTAELAPLTDLADYPIYRNEKIVLYSDGGIHSAQAWFLLAARSYASVNILLGGLDEWKGIVLFPVLPANASAEETAIFTQLASMSEFFGGKPRTSGSGTTENATFEMPEAPVAASVPLQPRKRKRKEGC